MAIKRLTIELDDRIDPQEPTGVTVALHSQATALTEGQKPTGLPDYDSLEDAENNPQKKIIASAGKTYADVIVLFIDNPRFMTTLLMFLPIPFFATQIKLLTDLKVPVSIGLLLNFIWHVTVPAVSAICRWIKNKLQKVH